MKQIIVAMFDRFLIDVSIEFERCVTELQFSERFLRELNCLTTAFAISCNFRDRDAMDVHVSSLDLFRRSHPLNNKI